MRHRKSMLSTAIAVCLGIAMPVHAQEAAGEAAADEATELDRVVVTGIRASLQQALDTKRNSDAIIDVVTAEDVGKFPSTNVAEAISTLPGVTIDKAFGQGEKISILGTDPALSRTLLNGQTVASADWFITDQPGRTFNYSLLAPQLVGRVEVYKSPEAHIDEGSIGGTVIVHTRKPLDLERTTIAGHVGYLYNDRIEGGDPQASLLFGWKNEAGNFGVIVAAQRADEGIRRDGVESYGTVTGRDYAEGQGGGGSFDPTMDWGAGVEVPGPCSGACEATLRANPDAIAPNSISAHYFEQQRERDTISVALQFRPHEKLDIEFNALDVTAHYDNISHSMFAFNGNAWNSLMRLRDLEVEGGVITRASFTNALTVYDLINRQATVDTDSYDLKATWNDERWFASAHAGTTKATGGTGRQVFGEFLNWADYSYDLTGTPRLDFGGYNYGSAPATSPNLPGSPFTDPDAFRIDGGWGADPNDPAGWNTGWGGNIVTKPTWDEETYGQVDFGIRLDSPVYQVRFGLKRREHETGQTMAGVAVAAVAGYGDATTARFSPRPLPSNYLSGFGDTGDLSNRFTIDGWALADWILSGDWLAPWQTMPTPDVFADPSFVQNTWTVTEDVDAAYVQADYSWNGLRGNVGVRFVRTESDSMGWQCTTGAACTADAYAQVSVRKKYEDFLPNLNVVYDLANDLVLRFSAAKVISRPNFGDMSTYLWLGPQTLTGGGGNPDLDPYRSTNLDFSAEWYFADNAILAGTVFHKEVGNYILHTTRTEQHLNVSNGEVMDFTVSRPDNAGEATIKGFSLAYQQALWGGLGLLANYTYADAEASNGDPMPWTSKDQYNISPFFENDRWSARVTYSWRSKYYTQVDRGNFLVTDDYESLDASIGFRINDRLSLTLDGMNLLDSEYYTYAQVEGVPNTEKLVRGLYRTGRRYMASLRMQF
ncbi:TonB-dependent receptor [Luteimonas wenzhouensis]|uniref:TonB-dependent receptor n=1 Tax=Luteimonas wenzhouensis TaxID=2599615 RepID=A0A5C5TUK9_9GAMM|nr:TonB-dependent receptor [Luteimonas wenzhouensis]TWT16870.1 TonB-dependent receptor [Luteimonas wenzhouensis]